LFVDFEPGIAGHTGRRARFTIDHIASGPPLEMHSDVARPPPYNPVLS
jgi:hypothetical protein